MNRSECLSSIKTRIMRTSAFPIRPARRMCNKLSRREIMAKLGYSLRALYCTLEDLGANPLREAHTRLDTAVRAAYAMPKDADPLAFLLAINLTLATKEKAGETITPPGLPLPQAE